MDDVVLASRTLYSGWINLLMLRLRLADQECDRTLVEHPSGSAVLAFDPARRVATIIRQTRYAPLFLGHARLDEPVSGALDDSSPEDTARREVLEEAGLVLRSLQCVGQVWITPSTTTERVHLFLGEYDEDGRVAAGGGILAEAEAIHHEEVALSDLWHRIMSSTMTDAKLFMLIHALRVRRPELFDADQ